LLILETMVVMTKSELISLVSESREYVPEPSGLYNDHGDGGTVPGALTEYMAEVFIKMQGLIDAGRKKGSEGKEVATGSIPMRS
jgi:hypothetical protein